MRVWKQPVPIEGDGTTKVEFPRECRFLTVQMQGDVPCVWAVVEPEGSPSVKWSLYWVGTGHEFPYVEGAAQDIDDARADYIGTVQIREFVFHLFNAGHDGA